MDADERRWLERLRDACEHILSSDEAASIRRYDAPLMQDITELLAQIRTRLDEPQCHSSEARAC
jgi:hypothetical protein